MRAEASHGPAGVEDLGVRFDLPFSLRIDQREIDRLLTVGPADVSSASELTFARNVFVHDRAADDFSLYAEIIDEMDNAGFVVRAQYNRKIRTPTGEDDKLFDWSSDFPEEGRTTIGYPTGWWAKGTACGVVNCNGDMSSSADKVCS